MCNVRHINVKIDLTMETKLKKGDLVIVRKYNDLGFNVYKRWRFGGKNIVFIDKDILAIVVDVGYNVEPYSNYVCKYVVEAIGSDLGRLYIPDDRRLMTVDRKEVHF